MNPRHWPGLQIPPISVSRRPTTMPWQIRAVLAVQGEPAQVSFNFMAGWHSLQSTAWKLCGQPSLLSNSVNNVAVDKLNLSRYSLNHCALQDLLPVSGWWEYFASFLKPFNQLPEILTALSPFTGQADSIFKFFIIIWFEYSGRISAKFNRAARSLNKTCCWIGC